MDGTNQKFSEFHIGCSNCGVPLGHVFNSDPEIPYLTRLVINCPYCGDKSYVYDIKGKYFLGSTDFVVYIDMQEIGGITYMKTEKGEKQWKQ